MSDFPCADVAVVIPAWNAAEFVADAVASALADPSTIGDVVVVDNASDDDTADVARRAGARVVPELQRGAGAARNTGVQHTVEPFVFFLDADDLLVPGSVRLLRSAIADADFAFGMVQNELMPGLVGNFEFPREPVLSATPSSTLLRRRILVSQGAFAPDNYSWLPWVSTLRDGAAVGVHVDSVVVTRRIHGANMTLNSGTYTPYFDLIRARLAARAENR